MQFDAKILIPLFGVALGWLLSSMTNLFKIRGEKKRILGVSISQLYYLTHELNVVIFHLEKAKDAFPIDQWEDYRQRAIERYTLKNEDSLSQLNRLIENISSISPSLGIELKFLIESYFFNRKVKFDSSKNNNKVYILLLSILETSQELTTSELEKILIKLSFKYNIIFGFKIKRKLKREKKNLENSGGKISNELFSLMKPKIDEPQ